VRRVGGANALVLIRADFWMAVTRFMQTLEIPLVEGRNQAVVDLFDPDHAQKVLALFGRAYGRLPDSAEAITAEQQRFLDLAVQGLAEDNKVICVRLAVFADMMKGRPWTESALGEVGGAEGVGVRFLDESFTAQTAPPSHRRHEKAARAVLQELLPEQGSDIKGQMKPYQSLLQASEYADRPGEFDALLTILDHELRLITPTEPDQTAAGDAPDAALTPDAKHYQLTHDYLAPSLRTWLTREKKKTRRGRAELRLAERAALWNAKPENQQLPNVWQYLNIRWLTDRKKWKAGEQKMMARAGRFHLIVASQLVAVNPAFVGQWQEALRPVSQQLLSPLAKIFTDPEQGELARSLATTLLTDYAKDDAARLTSLLVDADAKGFASLFPVLQQHQQAAVKELQAVVERQLEIPWNDPPLEPAWKEPSAEMRATIEAAQGMLAERFAFCTNLPWDDFSRLAESLRASGYRPTRVRPYRGPSSPAEKAIRSNGASNFGGGRLDPRWQTLGTGKRLDGRPASLAGIARRKRRLGAGRRRRPAGH
jgi:hypothetical protein